MTKLRFTHEKLTEVTDKAQKISCWQNDAVEEKKNTGKNSLHRQRQKKLFVSEKFPPPPPKKKTIMVLIPYLLTTSIAFNFLFKKAKASNKLHAVLRVSSMKQIL